ncbi:MAG TPA: class II fumarate hydratase [Myxococcota bacterium]|nr:class II fumarate hydratase [Myxococcota bacterium]
MTAERTRIERDSLGEMRVPADALWGASTQRAVENFPISGQRFPRVFLRALGLVKRAAALANGELGVLEPELASAVADAAAEVADGALDAHFPLDVFQTGSGTSTNMNANEVIAARARARLAERATQKSVHPNDHVNASQSSNDVIPTALHLAAKLALRDDLAPALALLEECLRGRARAFDGVVKLGRTHFMDATPVRLGQELSGWARQVELGRARVERAGEALAEVALGGTAVGTGLNCPPGFVAKVLAQLGRATGLELREARDHFEAQSARDACVEASGALRTVALSLAKIAADVRLLASGPRGGIGELVLPAIQPGSSIMPGKVNPVICEAVLQVAAQVVGNDAAIAAAAQQGQLELLTAIPVIARNLLESIRLLASAARVFAEKCLAGLEARADRAEALVEESLAMVTALAPAIGYDAAAEIAQEAWRTGRRVRELAREKGVLPPEKLEELLDPKRQTGR